METRNNKHFHKLLAATLAVSSSLGMITPVLAQTAAGQEIKNTATATFKDDEGKPYNSTSNEVVINVAEVAGIMIKAKAPEIPGQPGQPGIPKSNFNAGETFYIDFVVYNTGNDPTQFFIPGTVTLSDSTNFSLDLSKKIQIIKVDGANITPVDVGSGGNTGTLLGETLGSIKPYAGSGQETAGSITVRVPIQVLGNAAIGSKLKVSLGNTSSPDENNQDKSNDNDIKDVYTVDNQNGKGGETNSTTPPVKEAMATSAEVTVNARLQAFVTVLKAVSSYNNKSTPSDFTDDVLTYGLALKVGEAPPNITGVNASDLYGTKINVEGIEKSYVLVSDAIPEGTIFKSVNTPLPGWTAVYSTSDFSKNALQAEWSINVPPDKAQITRVGFIYETSETQKIAKNSSAINFSFDVTPKSTFKGGRIANIAQAFGQSQQGDTKPGTATQIVYDESGDQTPNNNLGTINPNDSTITGGINDGKAVTAKGDDPGKGSDLTNSNSSNPKTATNIGSSANQGGENTVYNVALEPYNGPKGQPKAEGTKGNTNNDFTNKSIVVDAKIPYNPNSPNDLTLDDAETEEVTFENTVENTSTSEEVISLLPTPPTNKSELLTNTKVTIFYPANETSATYTYDGTKFNLTSGTPIKVNVAAGGTADYKVTVDLPAAPQFKGFPVPITAFIDTNNDGSPIGDPANITIDRLYTNYLKLEKKAQIWDDKGNMILDFTSDPAALSAEAKVGRIIKYQITYENISVGNGNGATAGSNNGILFAKELVITEDGTAGTNTWFNLTIDPDYPGNSKGSATGDGKIDIDTDTKNGVDDIKVYINKPDDIAPGASGTFSFRRKIK